jgi:hypothetical protein
MSVRSACRASIEKHLHAMAAFTNRYGVEVCEIERGVLARAAGLHGKNAGKSFIS